MEFYEYARPSLMAGKKIIYIHGFASAGSTGTAERLRTLLPSATIISPDVPVEPAVAQAFLKDLCQKEQPDLIIGTSMGGMYTEQLNGFDRICVNPALHLEETIRKNIGLGKMEFQNPRADGETWFMVTKGLLEAFREITSQRFQTNDGDRVWGLFGREDTLVDCYDEFHAHYRQAIRFNGEHALNEKAMLHALLPVIQWVDDRQEKRKKRVLLINVDDVLLDTRNGEPVNEAVKGFRTLCESYDVYLLCQQDRQAWIDRSGLEQGNSGYPQGAFAGRLPDRRPQRGRRRRRFPGYPGEVWGRPLPELEPDAGILRPAGRAVTVRRQKSTVRPIGVAEYLQSL